MSRQPPISIRSRTILCQTLPDGQGISISDACTVEGYTPEQVVEKVVHMASEVMGPTGTVTCFVIDVSPAGEDGAIITNSVTRYRITWSQDVETEIEQYTIEV